METKVHSKRMLVIPLLFAISTVVVASYIWTSFGGSVPFQASGYRVTVTFPQASNLYPGDDVRIAGINVGQVAAVTRVGTEAKVTMQLQPRYAPLRADTRAILRTKTLLGEAYIELAPGNDHAPAIADGGRVAPQHVVAAQQLSDVLSTFDPKTRAQLQRLLAGWAAALKGRGEDLNQALGWQAPAMANFNTLLQTLDGQRSTLGHLISSAGQVLGTVGQSQGALQATVTAGDQVLRVTAERSAGLRATVDALPAFLSQLRGTADTARDASGDLNAAVAALTPVAPLVPPALRATSTLSPQLSSLFDALPALIAAGKQGLPAAMAIVKAAGPAVNQLSPALQQLVPVVQLAAVVRDSIVAAFANVASMGQGSITQANGVEDHYLAAIQLVWNEAVGGYQKRLPTNRQNPYPAPDSELDISHGGLRAYDCRNVNNPLLVPPIGPGAGAPPCLLQGPWTFNGVSAYFPRLKPAKP
jgi:virulence factor Mce-like protein